MVQHPYGTDMDAPWPDYDEVIRQQQEREKRIEQYTSHLKSLAARYSELEAQRKDLLGQIRELKLRMKVPAPRAPQ